MTFDSDDVLDVRSYRMGIGLLIVNNRGLIFMAQRRRSSHPTLQMPQGGIDPKDDGSVQYWETPYEAAKRELYEETGIYKNVMWKSISPWLTYSFPAHAARRSYNGQYIGQRQRWFLLSFYGDDSEINLGDEFSQWSWIHRSEVVNSTVPFKQGLYRKALTLLLGTRRDLMYNKNNIKNYE